MVWGLNTGGGTDSLHLSRLALGSTQPPVQWAPGLFPQGKAAGTWLWQPTPTHANVAGRVKLYHYSPCWTFMGCSTASFTFLHFLNHIKFQIIMTPLLPTYSMEQGLSWEA